MSLISSEEEAIQVLNKEYCFASRNNIEKFITMCVSRSWYKAAKHGVNMLDDKKLNVLNDLDVAYNALRAMLLHESIRDVVYDAIVKGINVTVKDLILYSPGAGEGLKNALGSHYSPDAMGIKAEHMKLTGMVMKTMAKVLQK